MTRNEQLWSIIETLPDLPIQDGPFVASVTQIMDEAETEERLNAIGRRLAKESLADCDREVLKIVFKECRQALRACNG